MKTKMIQLIQGDCLTEMQKIESCSVDAIITDPPYGTTACKWDSVIDFGLMWGQLNRVIKPNGAIVLFGSEPFSSALRMSNIKNYKYDWKWKKNKYGNFILASCQPIKEQEDVIVFSLGGASTTSKNKMKYNPQMEGKQLNQKQVRDVTNNNLGKTKIGYTFYKYKNNGAFPKNILEFVSDKNRQHPTQKPVALMEYLIKTYTNEGETVLDFTMGSGSTGVAAKNLNRSFIGIEQDPNYFKISAERINKQDLFSQIQNE
jgi:site-specific DNA-methyltransferase (adenine-specific)